MRETLTSLLDALAIILIAAGIGCQSAGWPAAYLHRTWGLGLGLAGVGLLVAGIVIFAASLYASRPPAPPPPITGEN